MEKKSEGQSDQVSEWLSEFYDANLRLRVISDCKSRIGHKHHTDPGLSAMWQMLTKESLKANATIERLLTTAQQIMSKE